MPAVGLASVLLGAGLERLAKLSAATGRTEASLLREALDGLLAKHGDQL